MAVVKRLQCMIACLQTITKGEYQFYHKYSTKQTKPSGVNLGQTPQNTACDRELQCIHPVGVTYIKQ